MRFGDVISEKKNGDLQKTIIFAGDFETITENGVTKNLYYISRGDGLTGHEHLPEFKLIDMNFHIEQEGMTYPCIMTVPLRPTRLVRP